MMVYRPNPAALLDRLRPSWHSPDCPVCIRHLPGKHDQSTHGHGKGGVRRELASGIPDDIWWNRVDHRQPYTGDNEMRWTALGDAEFPDWAMNTK